MSKANPNTLERSEAGVSIVQETLGFVEKNLSGPPEKKDGAGRERVRGWHVLSPRQHTVTGNARNALIGKLR